MIEPGSQVVLVVTGRQPRSTVDGPHVRRSTPIRATCSQRSGSRRSLQGMTGHRRAAPPRRPAAGTLLGAGARRAGRARSCSRRSSAFAAAARTARRDGTVADVDTTLPPTRAGARPARVRNLVPAREPRRAAAPAAPAARRRAARPRSPAESLDEMRSGASRGRTSNAARGSSIRLVLTCTSDRGDAANRAARAHPDRASSWRGSTTRCCCRTSTTRPRSGSPRRSTLLWQTDEVRHDRLRITDEIRHGLWFFEHSLMTPRPSSLGDWRERLPDAPPPLVFGSWIGGDMDGNPSAGPASIAEALDRGRALALGPLSRRGSQRSRSRSHRRARSSRSPTSSRRRSHATQRSSRSTRPRSGRATSSSPTGASSPSCGGGSATTATPTPTRLLADVRLIRDSLRAHGGRRDRRRPRRAARADDRDLRLPRREARRTAPCARPRKRPRARARLRRPTTAQRRARAAGARHADRVRARRRSTTFARARAADRPARRAALRDASTTSRRRRRSSTRCSPTTRARSR